MNRYYFATGIYVNYSISMLFALVLVFKYESSLILETEVLVWMLFRPTDHSSHVWNYLRANTTLDH